MGVRNVIIKTTSIVEKGVFLDGEQFRPKAGGQCATSGLKAVKSRGPV